jgi:hypothetical protein
MLCSVPQSDATRQKSMLSRVAQNNVKADENNVALEIIKLLTRRMTRGLSAVSNKDTGIEDFLSSWYH